MSDSKSIIGAIASHFESQMNESKSIIEAIAFHFESHLVERAASNLEQVPYESQHREFVDQICRDFLPRGTGVVEGTHFDWDGSSEDRLVFKLTYFYTNDEGYYAGRSYHTLIVKPSFLPKFKIKVKGKGKQNIKDWLRNTYIDDFNKRVVYAGGDKYRVAS